MLVHLIVHAFPCSFVKQLVQFSLRWAFLFVGVVVLIFGVFSSIHFHFIVLALEESSIALVGISWRIVVRWLQQSKILLMSLMIKGALALHFELFSPIITCLFSFGFIIAFLRLVFLFPDLDGRILRHQGYLDDLHGAFSQTDHPTFG